MYNKRILTGVAIALGLSLLSIRSCFSRVKSSYPQSRSITIDTIQVGKMTVPLVILGSGPAGLSAAVYGARANVKTLVIAGAQPGGQLTTTSDVENWPGEKRVKGPELMKKLEQQARDLGAEFLEDVVERVDFSSYPFKIYTQDNKEIHALSVIIATGATPDTLSVPGEKEYWGSGVTTCAICDAPFYKGKDVVVVGGGDSAAEEAMQLAPHVKSVTMLVRKRSLRAAPRMQDHLSAYQNIKIKYNRAIKEITGNGDHVTGVILQDTETGATEKMPIDGVFLAIGHKPNTQLFVNQLGMNDAGYLEVLGRSQSTTITGVFAAGDVEDFHYRQAGVAAGSGIKAALDATAFLQNSGFSNDVAAALTKRSAAKVAIETKAEVEPQEMQSVTEFDQILKTAQVPVIVDVYGTHCGPCKAMAPVFKSVAGEMAGKAIFIKVNDDNLGEISERYHISGVPTFLVFMKGELTDKVVGMMPKPKFAEFVQRVVERQ